MTKSVTMKVSEEDLEKIDRGALNEKRSRSNFMVLASLERATKGNE